MKKKAVVTGAGGFLGSRLCRFLLDKGWEVTGLGRHPAPPELSQLAHFKWIMRDLSIEGLSDSEIEQTDVVFHLAAILTTNGEKAERNLLRSNEVAAVHVFQTCLGRAERVIHVSTQMVYGDPNSVSVDENFPMDPFATAYGLSKWHSENWLRCLQKKQGGLAILLRFPGFVEGNSTAIRSFISSAKENKKIEVYSMGEICRDYLAVNDALEIFLKTAVMPFKDSKDVSTYNIGSGEILKALDLAKLICREIESSSEIIPVPTKAPRSHFVFNIERARKELGFAPIPLSQAVKNHVRKVSP